MFSIIEEFPKLLFSNLDWLVSFWNTIDVFIGLIVGPSFNHRVHFLQRVGVVWVFWITSLYCPDLWEAIRLAIRG